MAHLTEVNSLFSWANRQLSTVTHLHSMHYRNCGPPLTSFQQGQYLRLAPLLSQLSTKSLSPHYKPGLPEFTCPLTSSCPLLQLMMHPPLVCLGLAFHISLMSH